MLNNIKLVKSLLQTYLGCEHSIIYFFLEKINRNIKDIKTILTI